VTFHLRAGATSCRLCYPARLRSRNSPEKEIFLGGEPPRVPPVCDACETIRVVIVVSLLSTTTVSCSAITCACAVRCRDLPSAATAACLLSWYPLAVEIIQTILHAVVWYRYTDTIFYFHIRWYQIVCDVILRK